MTQWREVETVQMVDVVRQERVDAELRNFISEDNVEDWIEKWMPEQYRLIALLLERGNDAKYIFESSHWKWNEKVIELRLNPDQKGFSLVCDGITQVMSIVDLGKKCKLPSQIGKNLVYIEYIQSAPWNNRRLSHNAVRYLGGGTILMRKVVEFSRSMERSGRIGLHSFRGTEGFYKKIGMSDLGLDFSYYGLRG